MKKLRLRIFIRGAVQGVGFRPFIYKLATSLKLVGWVQNSTEGVVIEVEGCKSDLDQFVLSIDKDKPSISFIQSLEPCFLDVKGYKIFQIKESFLGNKTTIILPDIATCPDCREEILDPKNRRYRYPFTNCTHCGPRYSIIEALPYDRRNTSMKNFKMCKTCQDEYENPNNRRFHAQPNACPQCGPHFELWDRKEKILKTHEQALEQAAKIIKKGGIVALKGLGGFHLMVDARNENAILNLRKRKHRDAKPLAVMYPSLQEVKKDCEVSDLEERLLTSSESPIVLLKKKKSCQVCQTVAPRNPYLGVLLAYAPLHILLMDILKFPIVATSGNVAEETICITDKEAVKKLKDIADAFLIHNRPIIHHVDDSLVRVIKGREMVLRRARGYAPLPIPFKRIDKDILAVGPHLKNTIAISCDENIFVSQHIGDLETEKTFSTFKKTVEDFQKLYETNPRVVACDLHPGYLSTAFAEETNLSKIYIQHHYAHICACMAENEIDDEILGVCWDGTGYGEDGVVWGGEFLRINEHGFARIAHFKSFPLPGGEAAIKEPRRSALGLLYSRLGQQAFNQKDSESIKAFDAQELENIRTMLIKKINSPMTTSVGRIFDALSSLLGFCQVMDFEGQAAMDVEFATLEKESNSVYSFLIKKEDALVIDGPFIREILKDIQDGVSASIICVKFHNTLVDIIVAVAKRSGLQKIALTGGCFQNKYLLEKTIERLEEEHYSVYWHQRIPPNDGGIALGQVAAAARSKAF